MQTAARFAHVNRYVSFKYKGTFYAFDLFCFSVLLWQIDVEQNILTSELRVFLNEKKRSCLRERTKV